MNDSVFTIEEILKLHSLGMAVEINDGRVVCVKEDDGSGDHVLHDIKLVIKD